MHTRYDALEFDSVEYMASSGGLSCPDSDARNAYNLVAGFPQLEFNGGQTISGAGTDAINGSVYDPVVRSLLDDPTPLAMRISAWSFAAGSAFVTVDLELEEPLADISLTRLRVALIEDKVTYGTRQYDNILRDMLPDEPLSISQPGQTQQVTINFTMDPAWNDSRLRAVAFVQDDHDRTVLQSANTRPVPSYSLRYYVQGARTVITSGTHAFGQTGLFNTGVNPDTWDVTLDTAALPAGWSAHLEIGGNAVGSASIPLAPGGRALLNVVVDAGIHRRRFGGAQPALPERSDGRPSALLQGDHAGHARPGRRRRRGLRLRIALHHAGPGLDGQELRRLGPLLDRDHGGRSGHRSTWWSGPAGSRSRPSMPATARPSPPTWTAAAT